MTTAELAEALRPIIAEEVRKAMQSELREILTEAVEIASRPSQSDGTFEIEESAPAASRAHFDFEKPDWVQKLDEEQKTVAEAKNKPSKAGQAIDEDYQRNAITSLLVNTARSMTPEDKKNFG